VVRGGRSRCTLLEAVTPARTLPSVEEAPCRMPADSDVRRAVAQCSKLPAGAEILLANCLAHDADSSWMWRNFPTNALCAGVAGQVYSHDAEARERSLTPDERLLLHQEHSKR